MSRSTKDWHETSVFQISYKSKW